MSLPTASSVQTKTTEQAQWFMEEVHPHDSSLKAYLRGAFPAIPDVEDVVQESYVRIWKARLARPILSTKSFLFQAARHFAIDLLRRRATAATDNLGDLSELAVMEDGPNAADALGYAEKIEILAAAFVQLPPRCREIMTLRKLQGISNKEIAARLGIDERTVENQITRGTRLCRQYLIGRGIHSFNRE